MAIFLQLGQFEGPLDLLLHLIGNAKINIKDIFVSQVTDQYIQLVQQAQRLDMEEASEFISMAATLLLIKSRSMLPPPPAPEEEEECPEDLLIRQLEEYARFKQIAQQMYGFEVAASRIFSKLPDEFPLPPKSFELEGLTLEGLAEAFARISARIPASQEEEKTAGRMIRLEQYTIQGCMAGILKKMRKRTLSFSGLLSQCPSREEVVTVFLALLELLKQGRVGVRQEGIGGEIQVFKPVKESVIHAD